MTVTPSHHDNDDDVFGVNVDLPAVQIRVTYEYVPDVSVIDADETGDGWQFVIEGRALGGEGWVIFAEGLGGDTLPQAAATAIYILDEHVPGDSKQHAMHLIDGSAEQFADQFDDAFDVRAGDRALLPAGVEVNRVQE